MISWIFKVIRGGYALGKRVGRNATHAPRAFSLVFALVFSVLFTGLASAGLVPQPIGSAMQAFLGNTSSVAVAAELPREVPTDPERIIVDAIGVDVVIENPGSTNVSVLDVALQSGAVRYPGSARLGEDGNIFLFGHSTGLRVVRNEAYKAFNGLKKLEAGDVIRLQAGTMEYHYEVEQIRLVDANEAWVDLSVAKGVRHLTLSTCNTFGEVQERYVVDARFVKRAHIAQVR